MTGAELDRAQLEELTDRWTAAWEGRGLFTRCATPDVGYEDPLALEPLDGSDALERHAQRLRRALPDLRLERRGAPLAGGPGEGFACLPWRLAGTHRGELAGLPATDRFVVVHGLHYAELSDGLVRRRARLLRSARGGCPARVRTQPRLAGREHTAHAARLRAASPRALARSYLTVSVPVWLGWIVHT